MFWDVLGCFWDILEFFLKRGLGGFGMYWGGFWDVLGSLGTFWFFLVVLDFFVAVYVLEHFGRFGMFWDDLRHFWVVLGYYWMF